MNTKAQATSVEVVVWGSGPRVVLVHGSVINGPLTWSEQRPLGERWRLEVLNRRGYGKSLSPFVRSDFEEDARDIAALLGDGHTSSAIHTVLSAHSMLPRSARRLCGRLSSTNRLLSGCSKAIGRRTPSWRRSRP